MNTTRYYSDHGNSKRHPVVPHDHDWYDDGKGNRKQGPWTDVNDDYESHLNSDEDTINDNYIVTGSVTVGSVAIVLYLCKYLIATLTAPYTGGMSYVFVL